MPEKLLSPFSNEEVKPWLGKWNFRLHIKTIDPLEKIELETIYGSGFIVFTDRARLLALPKTDFEQKLINDSIAAANILFHRLKLAPVAIQPEQIQFFTREDMIRLFGIPTLDGKNHDGIAYIVRTEKTLLAQVLTHEMIHLSAFKRTKLSQSFDLPTDTHHNHLNEFRSGYNLIKRAGLSLFYVLDEAATDIFSYYLKRELCEIADYFESAEKHYLTRNFNYPLYCLLVDELIRLIMDNDEDYTQLSRQLLTDYVTGGKTFLRQLKRRLPHSLMVLANIKYKHPTEEIYRAAERLGIKNFRDILEKRLEKPKQF